MTKKGVLTAFYIFEGLLYIFFIAADLGFLKPGAFGLSSGILKYISICGVFAASLILMLSEKKLKQGIFCLIMLFTIFSDYFLLFSRNILPGLISFCIVQILYIYFIEKNADITNAGKCFSIRLLVCFLTALVIYAILFLFMKEDILKGGAALIAVVVLYGTLFTGNVLLSVRRLHCCRITAGLVLFYLCDINVLLFNLPGFFELGPGLRHFCLDIAAVLMWVFYLPGKILLFSSQTN